jgi:hypothetical protein
MHIISIPAIPIYISYHNSVSVLKISKVFDQCMVSDNGLFLYVLYEDVCDVVSLGTSKGSVFECVIVFSCVFYILFTSQKKMMTACGVMELTKILI